MYKRSLALLLKLISYVLGCAFVLSPTQDLRASYPEEEPKPKQAERKVKVGDGYRAPHTSLAVTDITGGSEFQQKLQKLAEEQKKLEDSVMQNKSASSQGKKRKVKKTAVAISSDAKTAKKTSIKQVPLSRVPETRDVSLEEVSSAPQTIPTSTTELHPALQPNLLTIFPDFPSALPSDLPKRREITTADLATLMPFVSDKTEKIASSSSSPKQKTTKKKASKEDRKKEKSPQAAPSKGRIGKNYSPDQLWEIRPEHRPQIREESPLLKAKDIIAPKELYPIHILLAIAAGTRQEQVEDLITKKPKIVTKQNKVYIPEIRMFLGFKIMEVGTLDLLKSKLLFDNFSQSEDVQKLLKLICIKGEDDFSKITTAFMQKADGDIQSLTHQHFYKSGIRVKRADVEKRPEGNTLGDKFKSNYGIYELFEDGELIGNLQVRLAFSTLK